MCDPISATLAIVGTGISAAGTIMAGQQAADAAHLKAQIDSTNYLNQATQKRTQANAEQAAGQFAVRRQQEASERLSAQQRVSLAAQGVEIDSGSPLDTIIDSKTQASMDQGVTMYNAARKAQSLRGDAAIAQGNADMSLIAGDITADNATTNSFMQAGGTLFKSAGGIMDRTGLGKSLFQ